MVITMSQAMAMGRIVPFHDGDFFASSDVVVMVSAGG